MYSINFIDADLRKGRTLFNFIGGSDVLGGPVVARKMMNRPAVKVNVSRLTKNRESRRFLLLRKNRKSSFSRHPKSRVVDRASTHAFS